jgi:hypothetical protein
MSTAVVGLLARTASVAAQAAHGKKEEARPVAPTGETQEVLDEARAYRSWQRFPRYAERPVLSKGHGNTYVVAWYNEVAAAAAKAPGRDFPEGSLIVKENRAEPGASPASLSVMAKRAGSWYWVKAAPDGRVFTSNGKPVAGREVAGCAGCHTAAEDDMVFSR